jgi:hypothetical protein
LKEVRKKERESFDSGEWEKMQGTEADGAQDRTDKEEQATKGNRRNTRIRLSAGFFIAEQAQSDSQAKLVVADFSRSKIELS